MTKNQARSIAITALSDMTSEAERQMRREWNAKGGRTSKRGKDLGKRKPKHNIIHNCTIDGCNGMHHARGLCNKHYLRVRRAT
jgi:hypothetical protein